MPTAIELPYHVTFFTYGVQFVTDSTFKLYKKKYFTIGINCVGTYKVHISVKRHGFLSLFYFLVFYLFISFASFLLFIFFSIPYQFSIKYYQPK